MTVCNMKLYLMLFVAVLLMYVKTATAQTNTAKVAGTVLDTTGLPLPGVQIGFDSSSGVQLSATSGSDGGFSFQLPSWGSYTVQVKASGFAVLTRNVDLSSSTEMIILRLESVVFSFSGCDRFVRCGRDLHGLS